MKLWRIVCYGVFQFIAEYDPPPVIINNPNIMDSSDDGLVDDGCFSCTAGCKLDDLLKEFYKLDNSSYAKFPLGFSSGGETGLQLLAYIAEYNIAGDRYQNYSFNTGIIAEYYGEENDTMWKFNTIRRPMGGEILLGWHWNGDLPSYATPINGASYTLYPAENGLREVKFANGVSHFFGGTSGSGGLAFCRKIVDDEVLECAPQGTGQSTIYDTGHITHVISPQMKAVPVYNGEMIVDVDYYTPDGTISLGRLSTTEGIGSPQSCGGAGGGDGGENDETAYIEYAYYDANNVLESCSRTFNYPDGRTVREIYQVSGGSVGAVKQLMELSAPQLHENGEFSVDYTETVDGHVISRRTRYRDFGFGKVVIEETLAPDTAAARVTTHGYYTDMEQSGSWGKLRWTKHPDGSWEYYVYDSDGRVVREYALFVNSTLPTDAETGEVLEPATENCKVTEYDYTPATTADETYPGDSRARSIVKTVNGIEVGREYHLYLDHEYRRIVCRTPGAAWDAADNLVTVKYAYTSGGFSGRHWKQLNPDGTMSITSYALNGDQLTTTVERGCSSGGTVSDGMRSIDTVNAAGAPVNSTTVDIASGLTLSSATYTTDAFGRVTRVDYNDGTFTSTVYGCCGPSEQRDREGAITVTAYDELKRLDHTSSDGITQLFSYDPEGRVIMSAVKGRDNSELVTINDYDAAGELVAVTTPDNQVTSYAESWITDENEQQWRVRTTTHPDGSTLIEKFNRDGTLAEISGTAARRVKYEYGVENGELYTRIIQVGDNDSETNWTKSYTDFTGQQYKTVYADSSQALTVFDAANRPVKQTSPGGVVTLSAYNAQSEVVASAIDMNANNTIDYASTDRVTGYDNSVATRNDTVVRKNVVNIYPVDNDATPVAASITENSADGWQSWRNSFGRVTHTATTLNGGGAKSVAVTNPDGSTVVADYLNNRLICSTHSVLGTTSYTYDEFNRLASVARNENGQTRTTSYTYDVMGRTLSVTESGGANSRVTTYEYDVMGRRVKATLPGGRIVDYAYAPTNELTSVSGSDTYPQSFTYDALGRKKSLITYQSYPGTTQTTSWSYDPLRGFMSAKTYPDNSQAQYTYNPDGQILTRTWSRGIVTTYGYDNAGTLLSVSYSDSTPSVTYTRDRLGRPASVADAAGTHTFTYNPDSTLQSVTIPHIVNGKLEYAYDNSGRRTSMQLKQNDLPLVAHQYTYDAMSRLASVSDLSAVPGQAGGTHTAAYTRIPGTSLLDTTTITNMPQSATLLTTTRAYDGFNRLLSTTSESSVSSVVKSYSYEYNDRDQRTRLTLSDGSYWLYTYDDKGQVVSGTKHAPDGSPVPGQKFEYDFDDIGNLTTQKDGLPQMQFDYTTNIVNQYTQRTVPGIIPIVGKASADATVSVKLPSRGNAPNAVTRAARYPSAQPGETYFVAPIAVDNSTSAVTEQLDINAIKYDPVQDKDVVRTISGSYTVPQTPQSFTYDADGNMISDGAWTYTYNAENRPITVTDTEDTKKFEYVYDYQGRRIEEKYFIKTGVDWTISKHLKFVHDSFKKIAEYDGTTGTVLKTYVWGDETPLCVNDGSAAYYYIVDGNKNIRALTNTAGEVVAEYNYGPFGNIISQSGTYADSNMYRFSSEYFNPVLNSYDYGFRDYRVDLMRWTTRDPIEEQGDANLYGFVNNNPANSTDMIGLFTLESAAMSKYLEVNKIDSLKYYAILLDNARLQSLIGKFRRYYAGLSKQQKFNIWYEFESHDISWVYNLPKCPTKVCRTKGKYVIPCQAGVNPDQWHEPTAATYFTQKYHTTHAQVELRSKPVNGHSNQCIYKKSDRKNLFVISKDKDDIPMPGTADFRAPGGWGGEIWDNLTNSGDGHQQHDVIPFDLAQELGKVSEYYNVRPIWSL